MLLKQVVERIVENGALAAEAYESRDFRVFKSLVGPAWRGLILERAKNVRSTKRPLGYAAHFDWSYDRDFPELARLYEAAKTSQWNASADLDWTADVRRDDPEMELLPDTFMPPSTLPSWSKLTADEKNVRRHALLSWLLSQFLHGEQGALFAAAQVTEAVPWMDAKLYGSTQVVDEGRHVETFHRYLSTKLEKQYDINDNLYVVIDALMTDSRWDVKFLGMQIMIEGLALGAFGTIRQVSPEPLLKELLKYVIGDEARHVHFGVLALKQIYRNELSERERLERENWAFELTILLRNRFLAHEFYDEFYAHEMSRKAWDELVSASELMQFFRKTMFRRIVPNLKTIGLLSDRVRGHYEKLGLLQYENERPATQLTASDLV